MQNKESKAAANLGGRFTFPGTGLTVNRVGYGAMQLAGKGVFGPPKDRDAAVAMLREAIESVVNLLIPGTSSVAHLRENLSVAKLRLPADVVEKLSGIAASH